MESSYAFPASGVHWLRYRDPTVTFCLAASFDEICRELDIAYLRDAWSGLASTLVRFGLQPTDCELGAGHPGLLENEPEHVEQTPLTGFGWLMRESVVVDRLFGEDGTRTVPRSSDLLAVWNEMDHELRGLHVPVLVARHGYRSHVFRRDAAHPLPRDDFELMLSLLFEYAADDPSCWRARTDAGTGLWEQCAAAIAHGDADSVYSAVLACVHEYSDAGRDLVVRNFIARLLWQPQPAP